MRDKNMVCDFGQQREFDDGVTEQAAPLLLYLRWYTA